MNDSPKVVARLAGGLGNQLFMYAFNKALAERNHVPLELDATTGFSQDRHYQRTHLLHRLLPAEAQANRWVIRNFPLGKHIRKLDRWINRNRPLSQRYYIEEPSLAFDADIRNLKITRTTVFNGYWQSPQYFDDMLPPLQDRINFDTTLIDPLGDDIAKIHATGKQAVCLAIRRYEEVPNPKHHILPLGYFQRAMSEIEKRVKNPHYFVFAQAMDWAKTNIRSTHPITYATERDTHDGVIQDLYLMTQCQHFILSNSSLHWWAAWLNPKKDKIVICPESGWPNLDMLPSDWTRLD